MGTSYLLGHGVAGMPHHRSLVARWCSQLKKYHLLAIFSFVRLHQVQGLMNLRQPLEAAVDAAFAVAHVDGLSRAVRQQQVLGRLACGRPAGRDPGLCRSHCDPPRWRHRWRAFAESIRPRAAIPAGISTLSKI
jgi:hypothetical protein